jgi:hypothetical protein
MEAVFTVYTVQHSVKDTIRLRATAPHARMHACSAHLHVHTCLPATTAPPAQGDKGTQHEDRCANNRIELAA